MNFDANYAQWNQKRIKYVIEHFGYPFFKYKTMLDLGCGLGDIGAAFNRLGADVTSVDIRNDNLSLVAKKYPGLKTKQVNLDYNWPFKKIDVIMDMGLLCHLYNIRDHLINVCNSATTLVLETAVCDSSDSELCHFVNENTHNPTFSFNGLGARPTAAYIEKILSECGMIFKRHDNPKLNNKNYVYDWKVSESKTFDLNKRRLWIATKAQNVPYKSDITTTMTTPVPLVSPTAPPEPDSIPTATPIQTISVNLSSTSPIIPPSPPVNSNKKEKFVIIIPSYNNQQWCQKNISSALSQDYENYRVIFTDDASTDNTFSEVSNIVNTSPRASKCTLVRNNVRKGALENLYNMIHSCSDDEIILTLDGDDWFPDANVLNKLQEIYSSGEIWMTYGQYKNHPDGAHGISQPYPSHVINNNSFRSHVWSASHLRTFYAWLFKKIRKEDLFHEGKFFAMTWDFAIMFPMLEMAGEHSKFISDILYVYNMENPINDHKVNVRLQQNLDHHIRSMPKYSKSEKPQFIQKKIEKSSGKPSVGLLVIATGKYHQFIQGLITSADNFFLKDICNVTYYIFSDTTHSITTSRNVAQIPIEHRSFPFASMDRFKHFVNNSDKFFEEDYLYYVDVDCLFVDHVSSEILGDLVGVRHCGYINKVGPYENNPQSAAYVDNTYPKKYKYYYGGGFSGGSKDNYLKLAKSCCTIINKDIANGQMPLWHDETVLNRYFLDHEPTISLTPSYHYPQGNIDYYKAMWAPDYYSPKILLLEKDHKNIRI